VRTDATAPPVTVATAVAGLVDEIRRLHDRLAAAPSLRPGPEVDGLLHRLVDLVVADRADGEVAAVLADPAIVALRPSLIARCARAEHELELAWAEQIVASRLPRLTLLRFPYLQNYALLTALEHAALVRAGEGRPRMPRRVLFVGGGPLPLSAFHLARRLSVTVDVLDRDLRSVELARRLVDRLAVPGVTIGPGDLADRHDLSGYDLVVLAALVGVTPAAKERHLRHLHRTMAPGAVLLARSAHGLRTLLYPEVDPGRLAGLRLVSLTHPTGPVLNSPLLAMA
jgi:hypothetical protein